MQGECKGNAETRLMNINGTYTYLYRYLYQNEVYLHAHTTTNGALIVMLGQVVTLTGVVPAPYKTSLICKAATFACFSSNRISSQ